MTYPCRKANQQHEQCVPKQCSLVSTLFFPMFCDWFHSLVSVTNNNESMWPREGRASVVGWGWLAEPSSPSPGREQIHKAHDWKVPTFTHATLKKEHGSKREGVHMQPVCCGLWLAALCLKALPGVHGQPCTAGGGIENTRLVWAMYTQYICHVGVGCVCVCVCGMGGGWNDMQNKGADQQLLIRAPASLFVQIQPEWDVSSDSGCPLRVDTLLNKSQRRRIAFFSLVARGHARRARRTWTKTCATSRARASMRARGAPRERGEIRGAFTNNNNNNNNNNENETVQPMCWVEDGKKTTTTHFWHDRRTSTAIFCPLRPFSRRALARSGPSIPPPRVIGEGMERRRDKVCSRGLLCTIPLWGKAGVQVRPRDARNMPPLAEPRCERCARGSVATPWPAPKRRP